jgi:hypothetical protein
LLFPHEMRFLKSILPVLPAFVLPACMVVPAIDTDTPVSCDTHTRSMTLKTIEFDHGQVRCNDEACLAVILAVSAGSVVVSGSIVLTNNTIHWLEYQGTCSNGYLNAAKRRFLESFDNAKPVAGKQL